MELFELEDGWYTDPECTYPKGKLGWNKNKKKKMSDKLRPIIKYYNDQKKQDNLQRFDTIVVTITIDRIKVGKLIGMKGNNIRNLQRISNTKISIKRCASNDTNAIVKISGTYMAILEAEQMIENILKQVSPCSKTTNNHRPDIDTKFNLKSKSSITGYKQNSIVNYFPFITMPIDVNIVGKFIGKEGRNIKQLQDESNTIIRVRIVNPYPIIIIIGLPILIRKAKILIKKCLKRLSCFTKNNYRSLTLNKCDEVSPVFIGNPQIIKNLYREDPVIANMSKKKVNMIKKANNIIEVKYMKDLYNNINDFSIPNPILTFEQAFSNYPAMLKKIREQDLEKPNSIECQAWPILLSGKDMLGIAPAKLDKTLAFLLPALIHISKQNSFFTGNGPNVLILVANKMQALKIQKEVQRFSYFGIKAVSVCLGCNKNQQIKALRKNVEILIATSQRLNVLVNMNVVKLKYVTYVVLNEIGHMLDMKLAFHIKKSLSYVRMDSQFVMISSANLSTSIRRFANIYMKNPIVLNVQSVQSVLYNIRHEVQYVSREAKKFHRLLQFIQKMNLKEKMIVFTNEISRIDELECNLIRANINRKSILSLKDISDRRTAKLKIEETTARIIITTDLLFTEFDINDIVYVYNYDLTFKFKKYNRRIRWAICDDKTGVSVILMTKKNRNDARRLITLLTNSDQEVPENLYAIAEMYKIRKEKQMKMQKRMIKM
ncbi:hypothetical protein M0804_012369 [Polistes exclamans]|nr:hypothetical protein M0804_012369 [Polistes exclamans]